MGELQVAAVHSGGVTVFGMLAYEVRVLIASHAFVSTNGVSCRGEP